MSSLPNLCDAFSSFVLLFVIIFWHQNYLFEKWIVKIFIVIT